MTRASVAQAREHVREALHLMEMHDAHHADCACEFCMALGEIEAALRELRALQKQEAAA